MVARGSGASSAVLISSRHCAERAFPWEQPNTDRVLRVKNTKTTRCALSMSDCELPPAIAPLMSGLRNNAMSVGVMMFRSSERVRFTVQVFGAVDPAGRLNRHPSIVQRHVST